TAFISSSSSSSSSPRLAVAPSAGRSSSSIRSEVGGQRPEVRGQRPEVRGQRSEVRGQRSEVRGQRSEVSGQRSEVRGQRSVVKKQRSETHHASRLSPPPTAFNGKEFLTWNEVRELQKNGTEFGSHTVNHPRLVDLNWPDIESEIGNSKSEIEGRLGWPVRTFAYPYAFPQADKHFADRFRQLLDQAGYACCVTT